MLFDYAPIREDDLPMLHAWLLRPHVKAWWSPTPSIAELREDYVLQGDEPNATRGYIARMDGDPVGFIQVYFVAGSGDGWWEEVTDPGARGIDQFLAHEAMLARGIGRAMIGAFVDRVFLDPAVTTIQTDPRPDNPRAIRCYEAVGFVRENPIVTPDGPALLMRCTRESRARVMSADPETQGLL